MSGMIDANDSQSVVPLDKLDHWMDTQGLPRGDIENLRLLGGGTQNILLLFERGGREYVLRRPPPHKRANSDETMRREARMLASLAGSDVPHPGFIRGCPDESVLGAAFYLMEPVEGFNASVSMPAPHNEKPEWRRQMGLSMVEAIAALGQVDHAAAGLADMGKTEAFLARQVPRWRKQLESYRSFENYSGPDIPEIDGIGEWLESNRPPEQPPGILHGDFHLANVMFRFDSPQLAAVVDWELCTIGDPMLDLGWLLATWPDDDGQTALDVVRVSPWDGFPKQEELVAHYAQRSWRDTSAIDWYTVLACYKLGIILEGSYARACAGKAPKKTGELLHAATLTLFQRARDLIER